MVKHSKIIFEWGVEIGVVTIVMLKLFVPHEFNMFPHS